ncbi:hypothetical protein HPB49_015888 [Dermacentor silvarum]|uniref:Uncharacterized protein n=1 Tax=Dermacentor silvarum TaxID=543639 RepID=A0ACB8CLG3_DERSI|nr:hypothetical protein HPB49_015888 [Dermacentor silvarum]
MFDWVPIELRMFTLTLDRKTGLSCPRRQLPVVQASAVTVHKSQGATYSSVVYEYDRKHPQKLVYCASEVYGFFHRVEMRAENVEGVLLSARLSYRFDTLFA